tara:strand:+ start:2546 stop:4435 length:1890 start_codon:yes stop_codon:yes gene_type:complete
MRYKTILLLLLINTLFAQSLTNSQLDKIKKELEKRPEAENVSISDIQLDEFTPEEVTLTTKATVDEKKKFFGYDYFKKDLKIYDNVPAPANYLLGPGDEIIISMWGESNIRSNFTLNKDGSIYYQDIGFINLSNKNIDEAELLLIEKLSNIYSTLKDENNSTNLSIEVGRLKSINVFFTGNIVSPGINLIHPFSDIFSAISQAGGINENGSLRTVQLIRSDKVINTVDFYSFFTEGKNNFSNIKIIDGDIIHIPNIGKRVLINGEINRPGYYELINGESAKNLIEYASGFSPNASSSIMVKNIVPLENRISDDNARSSKNVSTENLESIFLNNGDELFVNNIGDVSSTVKISGRVKNPGEYSAINSSLKDILDLAGGFNDPLFRESIRDDSIVVIRKDPSQFYGQEFVFSYDESANFKMNPDDQVFVYENSKYSNLFSILVKGEVNKRGSFQLKDEMTVQDAIDLAEGLSPLGNINGISVSEVFTSVNDQGEEVREIIPVNDASLDFKLTNGSIINVLPIENVINVEGNVYNPGLIVYSGRKSVKKYINLAGGPKPNTLSNRIYVKRANGKIKKVSLLRGLGVNVKPGDTIFVPEDLNPKEFDINSFIADMATTLANIAAILLIADQND